MERVLYCMAVLLLLFAPSMVRAQASLKRSVAVISSAKLTRQILWAFALALAASGEASAQTTLAVIAQYSIPYFASPQDVFGEPSVGQFEVNMHLCVAKEMTILDHMQYLRFILPSGESVYSEFRFQRAITRDPAGDKKCESIAAQAPTPQTKSTVSLQVTTDLDCNWKLDGKPQGVLKAGDSTVVEVSSSKHLVEATVVEVPSDKHLVEATSTDGLSTFRTVVEVNWVQQNVAIKLKADHQRLKADHQRQIMETDRAQHPTWTDPSTGLMWAGKDNGSDVLRDQAVNYCQNLTLGGYSGWRLPTIDELQGIYDPSVDLPGHFQGIGTPTVFDVTYHVKGNLNLSGGGWLWSSSPGEVPGTAWCLLFSSEPGYASSSGKRASPAPDNPHLKRALCVRLSGK